MKNSPTFTRLIIFDEKPSSKILKKLSLFALFLFFGNLCAQQNAKSPKAKDKFQYKQSQDFSVPPPPNITFPAQYPKGNKVFLQEVKQNLDGNVLKNLPENLATKIILKIGPKGNVLNISTFGTNEIFNEELKSAATKTTANILWTPGKNTAGEKVTDIVTLPFRMRNK